MSKETGGSAFPSKSSVCGGSSLDSKGMTLRDYFAGLAMQGMLSSGKWDWTAASNLATASYRQADAMLEARKKC